MEAALFLTYNSPSRLSCATDYIYTTLFPEQKHGVPKYECNRHVTPTLLRSNMPVDKITLTITRDISWQCRTY